MTEQDKLLLLKVRYTAKQAYSVVLSRMTRERRNMTEQERIGEYVTQLRRAAVSVTLSQEARDFIASWYETKRWLAPDLPVYNWFGNDHLTLEQGTPEDELRLSLRRMEEYISNLSHVNERATEVCSGLNQLVTLIEGQ